jgi:tetratricopeptide (TPR) repeat protein
MLLVFFCLGLLVSQSESFGDEFLEKGMAALRQERVQAAAYYFRSTAADNPENRVAKLRLAEVLVDLGELREAENAYRESMSDESLKRDAQVGLATLLRDLGRLKESQQLLEEVLQTSADFGPAHLQKALLMDQMREPELALQSYENAIENGVEDPRAPYRLAVLYAKRGEVREALGHLRHTFENAPERYVPRVVNGLRRVRNDFDQIRYLPEFRELLEDYREYWPEKVNLQ